jgi:hypothetical protein
MARALFDPSLIPALSVNADVLSGAKMEVLLAATTTPTSSWVAATGGSTNTNPVVADSAGRFGPVYLDVDVNYRIRVKSADGSDTLYDRSPINVGVSSGYATYAALAADTGASLIGTDQGDTLQEVIDGLYLGVFTSFAGTPPAIPLVQLHVHTSGYGSVGVGDAWYSYDGTVNGAYVTAHPLVSFLDSLGRGWKLSKRQPLYIEMAGGIANGTTPTDAALTALIALDTFDPGGSPSGMWVTAPEIRFGIGEYLFESTIDLTKIVRLIGLNNGGAHSGRSGGTVISFPGDITCIRLQNSNTSGVTTGSGPSAQNSLIQGFYIDGGGGTSTSAHAIHLRTSAIIRDCVFDKIAGNGIEAYATSGASGIVQGNANASRIENCIAYSVGGHGLHFKGNDANACVVDGFETVTCGGCGILDESGLGNNFFGLNIAGYGAKGVTQGGRHYTLCVASDTGTTPGTNPNIWNDAGTGAVSASYPAWSGATAYTPSCPILVPSASYSTRSIFTGVYVEGSFPSHIPAPAIMVGGQVTCTRRSNHITQDTSTYDVASPLLNSWGFGGQQGFSSGSTDYTNYGSYWASLIGRKPGYFFSARAGANLGSEWALRLDASSKDFIFDEGESSRAFTITTTFTARNFGRSAVVPYVFMPANFSLPNASGANRLMFSDGSAPASGYHAQGEICFFHGPTAGGKIGAVCVASGTPGTWKSFGAIDA